MVDRESGEVSLRKSLMDDPNNRENYGVSTQEEPLLACDLENDSTRNSELLKVPVKKKLPALFCCSVSPVENKTAIRVFELHAA